MTSDETTEQVARVIGSVMSRWDMDGRPDVDGGIDTLLARALADAGLLAPSHLREEWSTTNEWGDEDYCCGFDAREMVAGDGRPIVRRYVTDWLPVNPAEGDGRADQ